MITGPYVPGGLARFALAAAVLDSLPDATAVVDEDGRIASVNHAWQMFAVDNGGRPEATGVGVDYLAVCDAAAAAGCTEAATVGEGLRAVLRGQAVQSECEYPCPSPVAARWFLVRITRLAGPRPAAVVSHLSTTRRRSAEDLVARGAAQDPLTGLANRMTFAERLDEALSVRADHEVVGVLLLDLDSFKAVNDTNGPAAGDEVLMTSAHRLRTVAEASDSVARLGDDEFAILARRSSAEDLQRLHERVSRVLAEPHLVHGRRITVPGSVGVALAGPYDLAADVVRRADEAMHQAKRARRAGQPLPGGRTAPSGASADPG